MAADAFGVSVVPPRGFRCIDRQVIATVCDDGRHLIRLVSFLREDDSRATFLEVVECHDEFPDGRLWSLEMAVHRILHRVDDEGMRTSRPA